MHTDKPNESSPLKIYSFDVEGIGESLAPLERWGRLKQNETGLAYLDVDDNYIYRTYSLIKDRVAMPDYFGEKTLFIGAHISVFYPNENIILKQQDIEIPHHFEIEGLFKAKLLDLQIYVLKVKAPSLAALRRAYGLPPTLSYEGYFVDFHITVGTKILREGLC